MPKIVLDAEAFKVLASDTRLAILKKLDERPMTVSELGRDLSLNKATVFEHLASLTTGDLVKKKEREGRKWVYYTLTWKGKSLLHPENTTVMVLLGLATLGSGAAMLQLGHFLRWWGVGLLSEESGADAEGDEAGVPEAMPMDTQGSEADSAQKADAPEESGADGPGRLEDDSAADSDGGGFWDLLESSEFWVFALLFLLSTALFTVAAVIKVRARGRPGVIDEAMDEAQVRLKH